jgi:O-antigen ligase
MIFAGVFIVCIASGGTFAAREIADPGGGVRSRLLGFAFEYIPDYLLRGVGPNNYTTAIGPLSGTNIPVHNTLLLVVAETGIVGGFLLFAPIIVSFAQAWRFRSRDSYGGDSAKSLVAFAPGLLLIAMTGWGMVGTSIFMLWLFVTAFSFAIIREERSSKKLQKQSFGTNEMASSKIYLISAQKSDRRNFSSQKSFGA